MTMVEKSSCSRFFVLALVVASLFANGVAATAQTIYGSIGGTVTDQTGAAVIGARVVVRNLDTGFTRDTEVNDQGVYKISSLSIGRYSVEVTASGFGTATREAVTVNVSIETTVDVTLSPQGAAESVTVSADTGSLESTNSQVSKVVEERRILELPGRNSLDGLALLNPGVLPNQNGRPGSGFAVNGNRTRSNNFTIDGANNNDQSLSIPRQGLPPEAIGEFQIITNTFAAEYGRNSGSYINVITRSGTNDVHGTLFYQWAGNGLNALTTTEERIFKANRDAGLTDRQALRRARNVTVDNIYGATLGGPIKRDHTFFFASVDFQDFRSTISSTSRAALSAESRAFLQANRNQFASPESVDFILNTFPVANDPTPAGGSLALSTVPVRRADGSLVGNVAFLTANRTLTQGLPYGNDFDRVLGKINTRINDKDQLSFRYLLDQFDDPGAPASIEGLELGQDSRNQSFTINDVYLLTDKLINEFRFTYSRRRIRFPENFESVAGGAQIGVGGSFNAFNIGNVNFPQFRTDNVFELTDNVAYTTGNHAFKFGYNGLRYQLNNFFAPVSRGFISYADLNAFLNDDAQLIQRAVGEFGLNAVTYEHGAFIQDDWRITPDLTLNLGLRYEFVTTPFGFFSGARPDINNFGPRLGFAYNPKGFADGRFVFRGGFSVAYDQVFQNVLLNVSRNFPRAITNSIACEGCAPFAGLDAIPALNVGPNGFTGNPNLLDYRFFSPNERVVQPRSLQWTVSTQYLLGNDFIFKAEYIGTKGSNLVRELEQNFGFNTAVGGTGQRLDPTRGSVLVGQGVADSIYHAGQFTIEKRVGQFDVFGINFGGLTFNANYTYSSFISEADDVLGGQANRTLPADPRNPELDRARSAFDQPHRFVASAVYETPNFFSDSGVLNRIFGGWELAPIVVLASGTPFSILSANNALGLLPGQISTIQLSQRVSVNPNGQPGTFTTANAQGVPSDPNARFILLPANSGLLGNLGANTERTGGTIRTDVAAVKNIRTFGDSQRLQLRAEVFNVFNRRNFTVIPTNTLSATTIPGTFLNFGLTNVGGRVFTFGARYFF